MSMPGVDGAEGVISGPTDGHRRPILDLLADALHEATTLRFLDDGPRRTGRDLWRASEATSNWLASRVGSSGSVAAVFDTSFACLASVLGAWRAGARLASLPTRGRTTEVTEYRETVRSLAGALDADLVLSDPATVGLLDGIGVPVARFEETLAGGPPARPAGSASFVQFSSGTTARPKGVELTLAALGANVHALVSVLAHDDPVVCSWLPLSHDMGFVGTVLTGLAAGDPQIVGRTTVALMPASTFLRQPARFLAVCDQLGATTTSMPNFAMELLTRRPPRRPLDLRRLRACIVGAEPIHAETLRGFATALEPNGFDPLAICPAYGLAEATLAVTIVPPDEEWRSASVAIDALGAGAWVPEDGGGVELVCVGQALPGVELRSDGSADGIGRLAVRSPSLLSGYLGAGSPVDGDGWLVTSDLGHIGPEGVYVAGRTDELMFLADGNLHASALEPVIDASPVVRRHAGTAIPDGNGRYVVVAERRRASRVAALPAAAGELRTALAQRFGVGPSAVLFLRPGRFPRTTSGKLQRNLVARQLTQGDLDVEMQRDFGGPHG